MSQTHVGIDVSKHQLDVALWGSPENEPKAPGPLCGRVQRPTQIRRADTRMQMARVVEGMVGKYLRYHMFIADNGLPSGARS